MSPCDRRLTRVRIASERHLGDMTAKAITLLPVLRTLHVAVTITDPEVVNELERRPEGRERDEVVVEALRIGVLAMRHAHGALDVETIRRAGDDIVGAVRGAFLVHSAQINEKVAAVVARYFDPSSGVLPQRLDQLVKGGGDLERVLAKHLDGDRSTVHATLDKVIGPSSPIVKLLSPDQAGSVVASIKAAVDEMLARQQRAVLGQFSLDDKTSPLSRLVSEVTSANGKLRGELAEDFGKVIDEFSLDNEEGALARLVGRVEEAQETIVNQLSLDHDGSALQRMSNMLGETRGIIEKSLTLDVESSPLARMRRELTQTIDRMEGAQTKFQSEMREVLASLQARKDATDRSPRHGNDFEAAMESFLREDATRAGDLYERVGQRVGPGGTKKGDHLVLLGPDSAAPNARIVVESKANKKYTERNALDELAEARVNHGAHVGVFVFKVGCAPAGFEGLRRVGTNVLAAWDADDPSSDIYLRAAMSVGRALAMRERAAGERTEASLRAIERCIHEIEEQVKAIDAIAKAARNVQSKGSEILGTADKMKASLEEQLVALRKSLDSLAGPTS